MSKLFRRLYHRLRYHKQIRRGHALLHDVGEHVELNHTAYITKITRGRK